MIAGLQKLTLLDFPGHTACTVFLAGCNMRCPWCSNPEGMERRGRDYGTDEIINEFEIGLSSINKDYLYLALSKKNHNVLDAWSVGDAQRGFAATHHPPRLGSRSIPNARCTTNIGIACARSIPPTLTQGSRLHIVGRIARCRANYLRALSVG